VRGLQVNLLQRPQEERDGDKRRRGCEPHLPLGRSASTGCSGGQGPHPLYLNYLPGPGILKGFMPKVEGTVLSSEGKALQVFFVRGAAMRLELCHRYMRRSALSGFMGSRWWKGRCLSPGRRATPGYGPLHPREETRRGASRYGPAARAEVEEGCLVTPQVVPVPGKGGIRVLATSCFREAIGDDSHRLNEHMKGRTARRRASGVGGPQKGGDVNCPLPRLCAWAGRVSTTFYSSAAF
jgi:hypothetical protein